MSIFSKVLSLEFLVRLLLVLVSLIGVCGFGGSAQAGSVLDRVRAESVLHCAGEERPGLAKEIRGNWIGLEIDVCRAIAVAVLGPSARAEFHELETPKQ